MYHDYAEIERLQAKPNWQSELIKHLGDSELLLEEVRNVILYYVDGGREPYLPSIAREIAYSQSQIEMSIRDRVKRFVSRLIEAGALDLSLNDTSDSTKYASLTPYGAAILKDGSFRHVVFGQRYTLAQNRQAVALLTANGAAESGTAVHIGGGRFLTCCHCVEKGDVHLIDVNETSSEHPAVLDREAEEVDLATVKCPGLVHLPFVDVAPSPPSLLDRVLVLHFPNVPALLRALIATPGDINGRGANYLRHGHEDLLISARTAPGSSGGGVFSAEGKLCGIVLGSGSNVNSTDSKPDEATWAAEPFYHVIPSDQFSAAL